MRRCDDSGWYDGAFQSVSTMSQLIGSPNEYAGKLWPNGEFGFAPTRLIAASPVCKRDESKRGRWIKILLALYGLFETVQIICPGGKTATVLSLVLAQGAVAPLISTNVLNSHKTPRGRAGLTSYGGKMVRNACYLMEKRYGKDCLSFLTLTLPNLGDGDWLPVQQKWSEIVRVFLQWLSRKQEAGGLDKHYISVSEVQEKRLKRTGKMALHLHIVFVGRRKKRAWILSPNQIRKAWKRVLSKHLKESPTHYFWNSCVNIQRVQKSASAYLSKYVSKGRKAISALQSTLACQTLPASWWNCSLQMRKWLKREICKINADGVFVIYAMQAVSEQRLVVYIKSIFLEKEVFVNNTWKRIPTPIGVKGALSEEGVSTYRDLTKR